MRPRCFADSVICSCAVSDVLRWKPTVPPFGSAGAPPAGCRLTRAGRQPAWRGTHHGKGCNQLQSMTDAHRTPDESEPDNQFVRESRVNVAKAELENSTISLATPSCMSCVVRSRGVREVEKIEQCTKAKWRRWAPFALRGFRLSQTPRVFAQLLSLLSRSDRDLQRGTAAARRAETSRVLRPPQCLGHAPERAVVRRNVGARHFAVGPTFALMRPCRSSLGSLGSLLVAVTKATAETAMTRSHPRSNRRRGATDPARRRGAGDLRLGTAPVRCRRPWCLPPMPARPPPLPHPGPGAPPPPILRSPLPCATPALMRLSYRSTGGMSLRLLVHPARMIRR